MPCTDVSIAAMGICASLVGDDAVMGAAEKGRMPKQPDMRRIPRSDMTSTMT